MSKIIYYIGAGASCGRKEARELVDKGTENERLIIHEGLPVVAEIANSLLAFKKAIEDVTIEPEIKYMFKKRHPNMGSTLNHVRMKLINDVEDIYEAAKDHATIDTYAKKLFLTRQNKEFERLKNVLSTFFMWAQLEGKPDRRYDTFLANILQMDNLYLPKEISVISWNYDSQFEIAYQYYRANGSLPIFEKNVKGGVPPLKDSGRIFKINGSANFEDSTTVNSILKDTEVNPIIQLIYYYGNLYADTTSMGFLYRSHLSFAWETSDKQDQIMEAIKQTTMDTESIIVIGYSFPYFNREIDRAIFAEIPNLKTIHIQDPNPDAVEPSLRAVLPEGSKVKIDPQTDCTQFYLPREL